MSHPSTHSEQPQPAIEVFICYSHRDEEWREALEKHLASLQKQGKILTWHDRAIEAGKEWAAAIKAHLESAQIILLLISSDAIASTLYDQEMQWAIERHQRGEARVIPIILRPVDWQGTPFSHLTVLPADGQPVTTWANPDAAFLNVVQGIRGVVDRPDF